MGDSRYDKHLARVLEHGLPSLGELSDAELIQALAALAARGSSRDAYAANVLASEAMNRLARAQAAARHSSVGLVAVDEDGAGVFANPAAEAILGWSQRELRGVHVHTLIHDDARAACGLEASLEGGRMKVRDRTLFTRKDGTKVPVEFWTAPVERDGAREGVVLAFHLAGPAREFERS